jgi:hypothetical protein
LRRFEPEGCAPLFDCSPVRSLACYESYVTLGVDTTAQGAAGGGNIFNGAPLFGNQTGYTGGSSTGDNGATPTSTQSAFGSAGTTTGATSGSGFKLANYLPWILAAAGVLAAILFLRKKRK